MVWMMAAIVVAALATGAALANPRYPHIENVRVAVGDDPLWAAADFDDRGWEEMPWYRVDPQQRLLWVRSEVTLPNAVDMDAAPLAVAVAALASYEVYWNGERIGGSGTPGADRSLELPGNLDTTHYVPPRLLRDGPNVLALRMSSFHLRRELRRPVHWLALAEYGAIEQWVLKQRLPTIAMAGALLLGAVYFAMMFLTAQRDRGSLLLSLLSLGVLAQLVAELVRGLFPYPYPLHILRLEVILGAASASGLLLVAYAVERFALDQRRWLLALTGVAMAASAYFAPGFDSKTAGVILSALVVVVAAAGVGVRRGVAGAKTTVVVAAGLLVWLVSRPEGFVDRTYYFAVTAFLLFLFVQQVGLLRRVQDATAMAQLRAARLELELLKRQIQPHFLMNSLTAVSEWIETDPKTGVRMIEALAGELRALAAMSDKALVPLADELELCRQHLEVMSYRKDRRYTLTSEGVDTAQRLPPGILHTLVENALTHNAHATGAMLRLEVSKRGDRRVYRLRTPHAGGATGGGEGRGHAYVRARLQETYGNDWAFSAAHVDDEWVDTIEMPEDADARRHR